MRNAERLHSGLSALGFTLGGEISPVVAVVAPEVEIGVAFWRGLIDGGVYVNLALPPATPQNFTLLRCSLCAAHTTEQVDRIIEVFADVADSLVMLPKQPKKKVALG
jgi:8-amino-7-oxononanoate synthase